MRIGPKASSIWKDIAVIVLITIFIFSSLEGFASYILVFSKLQKAQILAERLHTEYDPLLGWINKPNIHIQDMYGPNRYIRTNSQRFRNNHDFDIDIPKGKRRWICSGDSFVLGYGVDNDHTWCSVLSSIVPGIESVNMGQGGYGLDQAYLWYMRDGVQLQHGWFYFDLIDEFRNLDSTSISELFIQKDIPGFIGSRGHYTEKGNRYIADLIVEKISSNSSIAKLVSISN